MAVPSSRWPNLHAVGALAAVAATSAAVSLVTVNRLKDAAIGASVRGEGIGPGVLLRALGVGDAVLLAAAAAAAAGLLVMELRGRAVSRLLRGATDAEAFVVLTMLVAWLGHSYLNPGILVGGDTGTHVSRFLEMRTGLDQGRIPQWTNMQYIGAPLLWFTGPLTYVVGGVLAWAVRDPVLTTKLMLFSMHVAAGWAFFAWLRRLDLRAVPAMLGAVAFVGSFGRLQMFLFRGVVPQVFTVLFLVLLFYAADGLLRGRGRRWVNALVFGLATAGMIINHQPHALFSAVYLAVFGGIALLLGFWRWRGVPVMVAAGVLGAVASVIAVLPVLLEQDWVEIEVGEAAVQFQWPTAVRLLRLVSWGNWAIRPGHDYWAYLGCGLVVFMAAGVVGLARGRLAPARRVIAIPALVCLALCLVLFNPVVRDIMFILFFGATLAAIGLEWLLSTPVLAGRRLAFAVLVMVLDLASTSVQPVLRTDKEFLLEAGRVLVRTGAEQRVVQVSVARDGSLAGDIGPTGSLLEYDALVQRVAGNHNMAATRVHNYLMAAVERVEHDLVRDGVLSPETRLVLRLLNVGRIVCDGVTAMGCPARLQGTTEEAGLGRVIRVDGTPALFSQRLAELEQGPGLDKPMYWPHYFGMPEFADWWVRIDRLLSAFVAAEGETTGSDVLRSIALYGPAPGVAGAVTAGWRPVIQSYHVGLERVRLVVTADAPGWAQMSHPWVPSMVVTVNGARVTPLRSAINLVVVPIGAGESTIILREGQTPARRAAELISLGGLLALLAFAGRLAWVDRRLKMGVGGDISRA